MRFVGKPCPESPPACVSLSVTRGLSGRKGAYDARMQDAWSFQCGRESSTLERVRKETTATTRRVPAWLFSVAFHGVSLVVFALLMPALIFHHESFGPPVQFVQRVEPEERVLPRWKPHAEMPVAPEVELVFEPVCEHEASEHEKPSESDVTVTVSGDPNPTTGYPVCAVGLRTHPRSYRPVESAAPVTVSPETPAVSVPQQVGGPSRAARVVGDLDPRYPERQRTAGRSATVLLLISLDEGGRPEDVEVLNEDVHSDFIKAAVSAARKAKYEPALVDGRPVGSKIRVRVQFQLQ